MTDVDLRLRNAYHLATPEQVRRGREWYTIAADHVTALGNRHGRPRLWSLAVFAITSPRCQLSVNLARTERAMRGEPVRGFAHMQRAVADPLANINGPKVRAFFNALAGMPNALVLDTWALVAAGYPVGHVLRVQERKDVTAAYRKAADDCNEMVRDFQAIVWIVTRESHVDARGRTFKRKDVDVLCLPATA